VGRVALFEIDCENILGREPVLGNTTPHSVIFCQV